MALVVVEQDPAGACAGPALVRAELLWKGEVLDLRHARVRRRVRLSELGVVGERTVVARSRRGAAELVLPDGGAAPPGARLRLRIGAAVVLVSLVSAEGHRAEPRAWWGDSRAARAVMAAALAHVAAIVIVMLQATPVASEVAREREAWEVRLARASAVLPGDLDESEARTPGSDSLATERTGPTERRDPEARRFARLARRDRPATPPAPGDPSSFGLLALLAHGASPVGPSPFARDASDDPAVAAAMATMFAPSIDDAVSRAGTPRGVPF
jgi:hypothetical protein